MSTIVTPVRIITIPETKFVFVVTEETIPFFAQAFETTEDAIIPASEVYIGYYAVHTWVGVWRLFSPAEFKQEFEIMTKHVRIPFSVEAIQITEENLTLLSHYIGREAIVQGLRCIVINRKIIPTTKKPNAYVGYWLTMTESRWHCYTPKMFKNLYEKYEAEQVLMFSDKNGWTGTLHM